MTESEIFDYMSALLDAVSVIHRHGIVHRDIKPSNFLRARDGRAYRLIDFGLAESARATPTSRFTSDDVVEFVERRFADDEQ